MAQEYEIPRDALAEFCQRHRINWLAFFGPNEAGVMQSDEPSPDEPLEVAVNFRPSTVVGLAALGKMRRELTKLAGRSTTVYSVRRVDPEFLDEVMNTARVQYDETG